MSLAAEDINITTAEDLTQRNYDAGTTIDVGDIKVINAEAVNDSYYKQTEVEVKLSDIGNRILGLPILDIDDQLKELENLKEGQAKFTLSEAQYDQVESTTNGTTSRASALVANNAIELNAAGDIQVTGSDLIADANATETGDLNLTAGGDVSIIESKDIHQSQSKETHGKGEVSFVVQHQAVEVAKAAEALKDAKDQLKQANEDYRQYEKDVNRLEQQRNQLKASLDAGEVGILYEDLVALDDLIGEAKSDEKWHQTGVTLAAANVASKTTLLVQQTAALGPSAATLGFNAGVQLDLDASVTDSQSYTETSRGSVLAGNNINIQTGNSADIKNTQTQIRGSDVQAANDINITTGELNIEASQDKSRSNTETESTHIQIAQTVYGAGAGGPTVSMDFSRSRAKDHNTTHTNSSLNAKNINLSSTGDTRIKGAEVKATEKLDVQVGGDLLVQSVQDKSSANSNSMGISAGLGSQNGSVSSVSGGLNASNSRSRNTQTLLTSVTGETVTIDVQGHTAQVGSVIAAVDENGEDNGQLTLTTGEYDHANLTNTQYSSGNSAGISTSVGLNNQGSQAEQNRTDEQGNPLRLNTTHVNFSNDLSVDRTKTLATLGSGAINIREDQASGEDSTQGLNRDIQNTEKELFSYDDSQSVEATIDARLLTETGREQIKEDAVDSYEFGEDVYRSTQQLSDSDELGLPEFLSTLENNTQGTQLKNDLVRNPENAHIVEGLKTQEGEAYAQAVQDLSRLAQDKFGLTITETHLYGSSETTSTSLGDNTLSDVQGGIVLDSTNSQYGDIFIDAEGTKRNQMNTLGHELIESKTLQQGGKNDGTQEALANAFGGQFEDRIDQATGSQLSSTSTTGWSQSLQNSQAVQRGTQAADKVGNSAVDHRQLSTPEMRWIRSSAAEFAEKQGISEEKATRRLSEELLSKVDASWSELYTEQGRTQDDAALNYLSTGPTELGLDKEALISYSENNADAYNDPLINAEPLRYLNDDLNAPLTEEAKHYRDNLAQQSDFNTLERAGDRASGAAKGFADQAQQIADGTVEFVDQLITDPIGTVKSGLDNVIQMVTSPGEVVEGVVDTLEERDQAATIARLQGDEENAARIHAETGAEIASIAIPSNRFGKVGNGDRVSGVGGPDSSVTHAHRGTEAGGTDAEMGSPLPNHKIKRTQGESAPTVNPPLRQQYENDVRALANKAEELRDLGKSDYEIATLLSQERNRLKLEYRAISDPDFVRRAKERNLKIYQNELGPSVDWLINNKNKSLQEIIESSARPGNADI